jgi:hypothetical protein
MKKTLGYSFVGLCVLATVLDVAWRAIASLSLVHVSFGSGALLAVLVVAPFVMKPTDANLNDVGIVRVDEDESVDARVNERPARMAPRKPARATATVNAHTA